MNCEIELPKRFMKRFFAYMAAYVVSILGMGYLRDDYSEEGWFIILVLLPVLFCYLALYEAWKGVMSMDELIRRIHLEGVFIGACVTGGVTFTWGLLTNIGAPDFDPTFVLPLLMAGWGIGAQIRQRAYQ